jgi:hypothetical protein
MLSISRKADRNDEWAAVSVLVGLCTRRQSQGIPLLGGGKPHGRVGVNVGVVSSLTGSVLRRDEALGC